MRTHVYMSLYEAYTVVDQGNCGPLITRLQSCDTSTRILQNFEAIQF